MFPTFSFNYLINAPVITHSAAANASHHNFRAKLANDLILQEWTTRQHVYRLLLDYTRAQLPADAATLPATRHGRTAISTMLQEQLGHRGALGQHDDPFTPTSALPHTDTRRSSTRSLT